MGITNDLSGVRLISAKYPPIRIFEDVASPEDFDLLYEVQALTNPRIQDEVGNLSLLDKSEIPYQCVGYRSYATAPFTHITPKGGRFNDGLFGALYIASDNATAVAEVHYHQQNYWSNVEGLAYERFVLRAFHFVFAPTSVFVVPKDDFQILAKENYQASQQLARDLIKEKYQCIEYPSVRNPTGTCWALLTPKPVQSVTQAFLLEMIWDGESISEVNQLSSI